MAGLTGGGVKLELAGESKRGRIAGGECPLLSPRSPRAARPLSARVRH